jgi:hypothetical protein
MTTLALVFFYFAYKIDLQSATSRNSHNPKKISCSRFLAQGIDPTALPKNVRLTYEANIFLKVLY